MMDNNTAAKSKFYMCLSFANIASILVEKNKLKSFLKISNVIFKTNEFNKKKLSINKLYSLHLLLFNKKSMPEVRNPTRGKQNKNAITMLNDAVNQHERGDIVLMKTLVNLNYYERMQTREKYESSYQTVTLKKEAKAFKICYKKCNQCRFFLLYKGFEKRINKSHG